MVGADLFYELVFTHGFGEMIHLVALSSEDGDSILTDVFKNQQPETFVFKGVENPRTTYVVDGLAMASCAEVVMDACGRRRDRGGDEVRVGHLNTSRWENGEEKRTSQLQLMYERQR